MVIHPRTYTQIHTPTVVQGGRGRGEGVDGTVIVKHSLAASIDGWTMGRGVGAERESA